MPASIDSFQVKVYPGDSAVLFAFDVAESDRAGLAGFAIQCTPQGRAPDWVPNRLTFDTPVHADAPLRAGRYADAIDAPFQSFYWAHFARPTRCWPKRPIAFRTPRRPCCSP
ncbi:hypothetical protein [Ralstonia pseudosolanacearum]|uniref:hypothetical protein n=1 Tax=Ralstonia pseudosolanacearum TaxID=1310165 RepID=UPI001FF7B1F2|nr:hypothetical protein [Ralstonia pseudosolanacearum]